MSLYIANSGSVVICKCDCGQKFRLMITDSYYQILCDYYYLYESSTLCRFYTKTKIQSTIYDSGQGAAP